LSGVIKGWQEGLQFFGKGGKGMLLVPSKMGYGSKPPAGIRVNAVLIFNIHLIDIK
jgi:FKBP-type peptidyl-prolyl cis-trans isomerase FkpA